MYYKLTFSILFLFIVRNLSAQYTCTVVSNCSEGDVSDTTVLYVNSYNIKNQLVTEDHKVMGDDYQQPYITTYKYDQNGLLKMVFDSSHYRKVIKEYSYKGDKIAQIRQITYNLSTENVNTREPLFPEDSLYRAIQPHIQYVWIIDTAYSIYRYNTKGLLNKISKKSTTDLYDRTETFEYDEKDRLIRSFLSDQFQYKYYYDENSRLIKKEKYSNSYIDDSSIGPDLKPESVRLKKAIWSLATTSKLTYNAAGQLVGLVEYNGFDSMAYHQENYFYDQKGRITQTTSRDTFADAYLPVCTIYYWYE